MYDFYPRSPCGERRHGVGFAKIDLAFLSTLSLRRATYGRINDISRLIFLSTLSLRRATKGQLYTSAYIQISIHALLAESDRQPAQLLYKPRMISIHALLAESDRRSVKLFRQNYISIHALLAESDFALLTVLNHLLRFLSTLSLRRATRQRHLISAAVIDFYPRSPCGERRMTLMQKCFVSIFLSTLSLRRATQGVHDADCRAAISIHALLAESDVTHVLHFPPAHGFLSTLSLRRATRYRSMSSWNTSDFYPRSPCGERPMGVTVLGIQHNFYPRSPCGERPCGAKTIPAKVGDFYPRSPCGERPTMIITTCTVSKFLSTLSLRRATGYTINFQTKSGFLSTLSLRRATTQ